MRDFRRFVKGVTFKPNDGGSNPIGNLSGVLTAADNGSVYHYQNRLKAFLDAAEREIITNDQHQTLTNKTIDSDVNIISNIVVDDLKSGVLNTSTTLASASNTQIPSALAVKTYVDDQVATKDAANEIEYSNISSGLVATNVQAAIDEIDVDVDDLNTLSGVAKNAQNLGTFTGSTIENNQSIKSALQYLETAHELHINDTEDAHDASAISVTPSIPIGLAANDVQEALEELQADINTRALNSDLTTHTSATSGVHGVTGSVVGTTDSQTLTNKTITGAILDGLTRAKDYISEESQDSSISGASAVITSPAKPIIRLTNASLISVTGISALESTTYGGVLTVVNATGNDIDILNNVGVASERILTGTDDDITLAPDAALLLKYDVVSDKYRVIGGTGSGSVIIKALAGENLSAREAVYLSVGAADSRTAGSAYKLDSSNDNRIEYVGLVKSTVTSGQTAKIITGGVVKGFTGLSVGVPLYLDTLNPGQFTQTEPTTSQRWILRLGIAISSTQVMILQDQGMTAFFNEEVQANVTIANNQVSAANVSNLVFDGAVAKKFIVDYGLYRSTDTTSLAQAGRLRGVYNEDAAEWYLSDDYSGQNAGVTFSITNGGQIQYTSSNMSGTGYVGTLEYRISIGDGVHVLGVMEQNGDLITRISGVNARLPIGAAGTAVVSNGSLPVYGYPAQLSTASGSAPSYAARAWVNFNGTGTVAIRASGNVTSITDLGGTGVYAVNFTTSMQDANYSIAGCCRVENRSGVLSQVVVCYHRSTAPTSNSVTIETMVDGGGANPFSVDTVYVTLQVFR
jgi:hypothetical protein